MELYNKRSVKILKLLCKFYKKDKTITGEQIGISVGVSSRTVRNDIKELNQVLKSHGAEVISEKGQGYRLDILEPELFHEFHDEITGSHSGEFSQNIIPSDPEERADYIMSKLLVSSLQPVPEKIDSFDLEDELFVSTSTLKKDLKNVDKILKKYDLRIGITKKQGVRIVGDEAKIRYCISEYIFDGSNIENTIENKFYKDIFSEYEIQVIKKILIDMIKKFDLRLTDIAYESILGHTLIMLKRFEREKLVEYKESDIQSFRTTKEFKCASEIIKRIDDELKIDLGGEVYYLTQHLISSHRLLIEGINDDYECKDVIEEILNKIRQYTSIDLSDDKQLINGLAMHLDVALQRLRFNMNIRNEFIDAIKNQYPLAFELAVLAGEVIEDNYQLRADENEIGFLAIHFGAALERKGLNQKIDKKKVIIVCIAGIATAMLLKEKIQRNFGTRIEVVQICSYQNLTQEMIDEVDLVLTTVDLPQFYSKKVKKIQLFLNDDDIVHIGRAIDAIDQIDQEVTLNTIFKENLFFVDTDVKTKQEAISYITNKMLEEGYITEEIKQSVFKREEMATTELGSLVAIPHALINDDMAEMAVSVMILKKPIQWEEEKVQVVLLLNIPQSKYDIWENVFKTLYKYLINQQGVAKLIKNKNYQDFITDLYAIENQNNDSIGRIR
jgi:lichenan operon transcriptional antiterminator